MKILRARDHLTTPWKNGGGVTTEICVSPLGAGWDEFDWRLSMAKVTSDGPFSRFPGIDRTLAVLSGQGVELNVGDGPPVKLAPSTAPFDFPGDAATGARLLDGPILDLNVMVRRNKYRCGVTRLSLDAPREPFMQGRQTVAFCFEGELRIETADGAAVLSSLDAVLIEPAGTTLRLQLAPDTVAYLIEMTQLTL